jgi:hypothetical protein
MQQHLRQDNDRQRSCQSASDDKLQDTARSRRWTHENRREIADRGIDARALRPGGIVRVACLAPAFKLHPAFGIIRPFAQPNEPLQRFGFCSLVIVGHGVLETLQSDVHTDRRFRGHFSRSFSGIGS